METIKTMAGEIDIQREVTFTYMTNGQYKQVTHLCTTLSSEMNEQGSILLNIICLDKKQQLVQSFHYCFVTVISVKPIENKDIH